MKKILIVEDDISISSELKELLDNSGYNGVILKDFENPKWHLKMIKICYNIFGGKKNAKNINRRRW